MGMGIADDPVRAQATTASRMVLDNILAEIVDFDQCVKRTVFKRMVVRRPAWSGS